MHSIYALIATITLLMSSSCVSWSRFWTGEERGAQIRGSIAGGETIESSISIPLNPYNLLNGRFDLYYFIEKAQGEISRKTVLFIAGGPGEFVMPTTTISTFAHFLVLSGYNVVFFHLRGAGFSQIPPEAEYDKFLRTPFAVEDIEDIRQDLIRQNLLNDEGKWDAIIAWSYGTVLAQQYTFAHQSSVDKLILFGPLSRHNVAAAGRQLRDQTQNILRDNLEKIYSPPAIYDQKTPDGRQKEFSDLTEEQKKQIFYTLFGGTDERGVFDPGVIERTEGAFGSINFVIDRYGDLRDKGELHRYNLQQFSCSFFEKLYQLRLVGWIGNAEAISAQKNIGAKIRDEILYPNIVGKEDCSNAVASSARVFYAMGTLDGIDIRFLREWFANGRTDVRDALRRSAGDAHVKRGVNEYVEKLGIGDDEMSESSVDGLPPQKTEWDPAKYKHRRPTLILKGEADPVTVGNQAEYFHSDALLGPRMLIPFPGIGHAFQLPETTFRQNLDGIIKLEAKRFSPGQVAEVKGTINGLKLNRNLNLKLFPPHDLEPGLALIGFGRVAGKALDGIGKDIVALIQNTGWKEVRGSKKVWKLDSEFFSGIVEMDDPGIVAVGETKTIYGKIIDPRQKEAYRIRVSAPKNWDLSVQALCSQVFDNPRAGGAKVQIMFLNQGNISTEGKIGRWTIYNDYFSTDFFVPKFPQPLASNNIIIDDDGQLSQEEARKLPAEARWSLQSENDFEGCLPRSEDLSRALAQQIQCDLPMVVQQSPKPSSSKEGQKKWKINNPMFSVTISSQLESCMSDGNPHVVKGMATLTLNDWIEIREPSISETKGDFQLLGYNILDGNRISLILKNPDSSNLKSIGDTGRDWFYALLSYRPSLQPCSSPLSSRAGARDCLIYSFLVMDPAQFNDTDHNVILDDINRRFKLETHRDIHFDPRSGGIRIPN